MGTAGMLLLIFALVKAPDHGWGSATTIGELAGAGALLAALVVNELRQGDPVLPLSIFRIKGLAAADATQVLAVAGFYSAFFFVTLYMQEVLHFSALRAGAAYVPVAAIVAIGAGGGWGLISRTGTRPLIVAGAVIAAGGIFWVSRIQAHGYYACTGGQTVSENWENGDQVNFNLSAYDQCTGVMQYFTGTDTVQGGKIVAASVIQTG